MGVLLCGSGHGRLQPGLRAVHALLGGGLLAFEWGGGAWWPIMVALALAMALSEFFLLDLILFPVLAHWMLAMAPPGLFSWA